MRKNTIVVWFDSLTDLMLLKAKELVHFPNQRGRYACVVLIGSSDLADVVCTAILLSCTETEAQVLYQCQIH